MRRVIKVSNKFKEILLLEIERNNILKESQFSHFALSDQIVYEQAEQTYLDKLNIAVARDLEEMIY